MNWLRWLARLRFHQPRRLIDRLANASDDMLQVLVDQAGTGIAIIDRGGAIVRANGSLGRMLALSAAPAAGSPVIDIFHAERRTEVSTGLAALLAGQTSPVTVTTMLRPVRQQAEMTAPAVIVSAVALHEAAGEVSGAILQLVDISAQHQLELQLAQSQKLQAVGQLAAGIAHDFNNLLTAILGAADEALGRRPPDQVTLEDLHQIRMSAERGADLVRQLLAFSRQQALQPRIIAINDAVHKISALLRRLIGSKVNLDLQLGAPGVMVRVDPTQLDQVLVNLAVNARHAMVGGGTLTVRTGLSTLAHALVRGPETIPPGRYVVIEVQDTGIGIPADQLPRIFDPFYTTRREQGGSGLGLSTVHGIVRQSGGYLEVASEAGNGARFSIYLPCYEPSVPLPPRALATPAPAPTAPPTPPRPAGGRLILLVDDEVGVRRLAVRALTRRGWSVLAADSGEAALELLQEDPNQLAALAAVISDVVMPGMDGPALVRALRQMRPDLPAILTSGYAEEAVRGELTLENVLVLSKPYSLKLMLDTVEQRALPLPPLTSRARQETSP
jgi:two-component system cell cycle sensor histidine kinase/response regulator CckA